MELGFEPGTLFPDPGCFRYKMLVEPHDNSESGKGNEVSVSQLNMNKSQRGLVTGTGSLSKKVALMGIEVMPFDFLGVFSVKTSSLFVQG